jgi:hypothetical protein
MSGISGLELFITTGAGFGLLGLWRRWVGQRCVLLGGWQLVGWSSQDRLWLIQSQRRCSPNEAESVISSNKSKKEQKIHYEQGAALTAKISSCWISSVSVLVVL